MGHLENLKTSRDPTLGLELCIHAKNALKNHVSQSFFSKGYFQMGPTHFLQRCRKNVWFL
jgi:hypothetical protein